ncbi:hypothetical protein LOK49_LG12G00304 [Camellia lanceoleosa]|uniref:Uncharacterized protein n=1 Tax=Camellia lanceoleosa TaxID=1840588 RepID=A0ACC0FVK3_9ERIC|nr:hypothetical protein LOK49_LG12G00304 [Camellia lanceoleosa]
MIKLKIEGQHLEINCLPTGTTVSILEHKPEGFCKGLCFCCQPTIAPHVEVPEVSWIQVLISPVYIRLDLIMLAVLKIM